MPILLFASDDSDLSKAIKYKTGPGARWSHAAILFYPHLILECLPHTGARLRYFPTRKPLYRDYAVGYINRPINWDMLTHVLGRHYDWTWSYDGKPKMPEEYDCSTVVGEVLGIRGPRYPRLNPAELWDACEWHLPTLEQMVETLCYHAPLELDGAASLWGAGGIPLS